jgi:CRP-like cAMP-binding protein/predicted MFS family arabinose efflux permease
MTESEHGRFRDALRVRDFRTLVAAYMLDGIGSWAYSVVMLVYVYERTGSTGAVATASAVRWLPGLLLSPYLSVLGDRYDRRKVIEVSSVVSGIIMVGMAFVVAADGPVWLLMLLALLTSTSIIPSLSAAAAIRPDLVEEKDLAASNALFIGLESLMVVIGPLLGAVFLAVDERSITFFINAASFFGGALIISRIRTRSQALAGTEDSASKQMVDGFRALWSEKVALTLVLFVALDSAVYGATTVLYIPMSEYFGNSAKGYGYLIAAFALGGVLVTGLINRLSASTRLAPIVLVSMLLLAVPFALSPLVHNLGGGLALQVVAGASMVAVDVLGITALQRDLPREMLSRVMGILTTLVIGGTLLGAMFPGVLLGPLGLSTTLVLFAALITAITIAGIRPLVIADSRSAALLAVLTPRIALLEALDLLSAATRPTLEGLAKAVEVVELDEGVVFVRQGDVADALWVIVTGAVEVSSVDDLGRERVHSGLGPHSYVGEIGLLRGIPRTATVRTTAPSTLWRIPAADVMAALAGGAASSSLNAVATTRLGQTQAWTQSQGPREPFVLPSQEPLGEAAEQARSSAPTAPTSVPITRPVEDYTPIPPVPSVPVSTVPAPVADAVPSGPAPGAPRPAAVPDHAGQLFPVDPAAPRIISLPDAAPAEPAQDAGRDSLQL